MYVQMRPVTAGCKYLVKLGTVASYTALDSEVEYARFHAEIEQHLEATAGEMKWTVLCPNWFMSNHLGDIFGTLPKGVVVYPVSVDAKASMVDPRDVGDLAAAMLLVPDPSTYHGLKLDVSGPEEVCVSQIAALYMEALGRPIAAVKCTIEDWIAGGIASGFPEWLATAVSKNFSKWDASKMAFPTSPEAMALAPPQRTMAQWVGEWALYSSHSAGRSALPDNTAAHCSVSFAVRKRDLALHVIKIISSQGR